MTSTQSNIATRWTRIGDIWKLTRNNRLLAIIEPAWSDHHCHLFIADTAGELSHDATIGHRSARLRICLQLWFQQASATSTAA
jgi:hypothetical protein